MWMTFVSRLFLNCRGKTNPSLGCWLWTLMRFSGAKTAWIFLYFSISQVIWSWGILAWSNNFIASRVWKGLSGFLICSQFFFHVSEPSLSALHFPTTIALAIHIVSLVLLIFTILFLFWHIFLDSKYSPWCKGFLPLPVGSLHTVTSSLICPSLILNLSFDCMTLSISCVMISPVNDDTSRHVMKTPSFNPGWLIVMRILSLPSTWQCLLISSISWSNMRGINASGETSSGNFFTSTW